MGDEYGPKALYKRGLDGEVLWSHALGKSDRGPKPVGARVRCIGDTGDMGIPEQCFGCVATVLEQEDSAWDGQLVDFGGEVGRLFVDPADLMLIVASADVQLPTRNVMSITPEKQIERWLLGESIHRDDGTLDGACCPDFSCCMPSLMASDEARAEYARAVRAGERDTEQGMIGAFRGLMMEKVCGSLFYDGRKKS